MLASSTNKEYAKEPDEVPEDEDEDEDEDMVSLKINMGNGYRFSNTNLLHCIIWLITCVSHSFFVQLTIDFALFVPDC